MQYMTSGKLRLITKTNRIWFSLAVAGMFATMTIAKEVVLVVPSPNGRFLIWKPASQALAIGQPFSLSVAGDTSGELQMGFTHSGYTDSSQPKRADLLVSFEIVESPITQKEMQDIQSQNLYYLPRAAMPQPAFTLDVSLPSSPQEEARVRTSLGLPKKMLMGTLQSLRIHWDNVPGATLYGWLTSDSGLKFKVSLTEGISVPVTYTTSLSHDRIHQWWGNNVGGDGEPLSWQGGSLPLAVQLAENGVLMKSAEPMIRGAYSWDLADIAGLTQLLDSQSHVNSAAMHILQFSELAGAAVVATYSETFQSTVSAESANQPGHVLDTHPEYVIDASAGKVGLLALKSSP